MMKNKGLQIFIMVLLPGIALIFACLILMGTRDLITRPIIGLTCDSNYMITEMDPDGAAIRAGFRIGDKIVAVDGSRKLSGDRLAAVSRHLTIGQTLTYEVVRNNDETMELTLQGNPPRPERIRLAYVNTAVYLCLLTIAIILNLKRPGHVPALLFFCLTITYLFFRMDHPRWPSEIGGRLYQTLYLLGFFMLPSLFAHFCSLFPKKNLVMHHSPRRVLWFYIPGFTLFVPAAFSHWIHFRDLKATQVIQAMILVQGFILWAVFLTVGTLMMIRAFFRIRSRILSRRCSIVFYAIFLATSPSFVAGILDIFHTKIGTDNIMATLLFLPLPIALAWAIDYGDDREEGLPWMLNRFFVKTD